MNSDKTSKLIDYLDGVLEGEALQAIESELASSPSLRQELEELKQVLVETQELPMEQPGVMQRSRFYDFLEKEIEKEKKSPDIYFSRFRIKREEWMVAAAVALLLIGLGFGSLWHRNQMQQQQIEHLQAELQSAKQMMMLAMLQNASASDRLQALNRVQASLHENVSPRVNQEILDALVHTMNYDENLNVQIKAAESLAEFSQDQSVITALIESLKLQESPEIQIILIDILTEVGAKEAALEFQNLLSGENTHEVVRQKAAYGIEILL